MRGSATAADCVLLFLCFTSAAVIASQGAALVTACKTDEDCALNGVCNMTSGVCLCDPGWTSIPEADGPQCSFLDFLPSPVSKCGPACAFHGGEGGVDMKTTSWGGSVMHNAQDNKYWMFAAEMAQRCTLSAWTTNSQVVTAVSDTPEGPFVRQTLAIPPWSHNPEAIKTPDGHYVIYTLGPGLGHTIEKNCTVATTTTTTTDSTIVSTSGGTESADATQTASHSTERETQQSQQVPPPNRPPGPVNFTLHASTSPAGPFVAHTFVVEGWTNTSWTLESPGNWNPAPVVLPDGRVRIMGHTDWAPWGGEVILEAPSWKGPYRVVGGDEIDHCSYCEEDPFMWIDGRGNWHVLYHRMFDPYGPLDPNWGQEDGTWKRPSSPVPLGWAGGHAFSRDGLSWSKWSRCYNTSVALVNGSRHEFQRRERPKLLFDVHGTPTHLFNGAITGDATLGTYTIVAPLNVPANRH